MAEPVLAAAAAAAGERAVPDGGVPRRGLDTPSKFAGPSTSSGSGTLVHDPAVSAQPPEGAEVRRSRSEVPSSPRQPGPQGETLPIRFLTLQSYAGLPIEALPVPPMLYPPYVGPATPQNPMQSYDSVQANIQTPYYENGISQPALFDQQREMLRYLKRLNEWLERDVLVRGIDRQDVIDQLDNLRKELDRIRNSPPPRIDSSYRQDLSASQENVGNLEALRDQVSSLTYGEGSGRARAEVDDYEDSRGPVEQGSRSGRLNEGERVQTIYRPSGNRPLPATQVSVPPTSGFPLESGAGYYPGRNVYAPSDPRLAFQPYDEDYQRELSDLLHQNVPVLGTPYPTVPPSVPPPLASGPVPYQSGEVPQSYPYPNIAAAAGIGGPGVHRFKPESDWRPSWNFFQLIAFRGATSTTIMIKPDWDDEQLLRELYRTYNKLRSWRRLFSLKTFSSMVHVWADVNYIYPQFSRSSPENASSSFKSMRIRYYFRHPKAQSGKTEFMQYLTRDRRFGVMYLERWDPYRITFLISGPVMATLVFSILWAYFMNNISDAFTIGSYMVTAYSTFLVLIGILNWVEF